MLEAIAGLVLGVALLFFADGIWRKTVGRNASRIAEIEAGDPETYFEELRTLQTYPSPNAKMFRAVGAFVVVISFVMLLLWLLEIGGD